MIPVLYESDEINFNHNGLGALSDALSCVVTEERNGTYELKLEYPCNGVHYADIQLGRIIYSTHDANLDPQPFDIYKISAAIDGVVTIYAHHVSYRLNDIVCTPFSVTSSTITNVFSNIKNHAVADVPFYFYTNKTNTANFDLSVPKEIRRILAGEEGSILDVFGTGEYQFDKFDVWLKTERGIDGDINIRYGKNMKRLEAERSVEGNYSAVVPFWTNPDTDAVILLDGLAVFASSMPIEHAYLTNEDDVYITDENGNPIDLNYPIITFSTMDLSSLWETEPTQEQLRQAATTRLNNSHAWETDENIEVEFTVDDASIPDELKKVCLCDTVGVYYPELGVSVKKKVIRTEYDALLERYDNIELGAPKSTVFDVIKKQTDQTLTPYVKRTYMAQAIENATNLITGATGGHVVFNTNADGQPEEILVMDADNIVSAVNVIRINKNGIGFSTTGYNGPYTTAWTIDGSFIANFITAGRLSSKDESTYFDLDTGDLSSVGSTRSIKFLSGFLYFYDSSYSDRFIGRVGSFRWGGDATKTGFTMLTAGTYLGLGYYTSNNLGVSSIVINNGLNPDGVGDNVITYGSTGIHNVLNLYNSSHVRFGRMLYTTGVDSRGETVSQFNISIGNSAVQTMTFSTSSEIVYTINNGGNPNGLTQKHLFAYDMYVDGNINCQSVTQRSDENLKNIEAWDESYDAVLDELEPICFKWKNKDDGLHVGLGARKTAGILDKHGLEDAALVLRDDAAGYSINYSELTVMLLKRVQEQEKRIADLERRLSECR